MFLLNDQASAWEGLKLRKPNPASSTVQVARFTNGIGGTSGAFHRGASYQNVSYRCQVDINEVTTQVDVSWQDYCEYYDVL